MTTIDLIRQTPPLQRTLTQQVIREVDVQTSGLTPAPWFIGVEIITILTLGAITTLLIAKLGR